MKGLDFTASRGLAIREFPLKTGFADYMLFVDRQIVYVVETKKKGTPLSGVDTHPVGEVPGWASRARSEGGNAAGFRLREHGC